MNRVRRLHLWAWYQVDVAVAWAASKLSEKTRWDVAMWVNDHVPGQCWSNLVMWAIREPMDDPDWRSDVPLRPITESCRKDAQACGRCYCAKLAADGSMLRPGETVPFDGGAS